MVLDPQEEPFCFHHIFTLLQDGTKIKVSVDITTETLPPKLSLQRDRQKKTFIFLGILQHYYANKETFCLF